MAEALGDRAGVASAFSGLGACYYSTGDYGRAREMYEQARAILLAGECPSNLVRDALPSLSRGAHTPVLRVAVCGY